MIVPDDIASQQRGRLYRVATLATGIFVHLMVCWTVFSIGYMNITPVGFLGLLSVAGAGFLLIALLILIEWNLTLEDPDLSVQQMLWALTVIVMTAHFTEHMKPLILMSGLALAVFGANRLNRSQQIFVASYGLLIYLLSVGILSRIEGLASITEIVLVLAFGIVLLFGPVLQQFERSVFEDRITDKNVELGRALEQIREMAVRDELTGVFNRRHLMEMLGQQKALADRKHYIFTVCYVDLDHFKKVNDRFGHATGDDVLRNFARCANSIVREVDCVARIGGEEFVLVMAGTSQIDARRGAQRLAAALKEMQVSPHETGYRITASVGITQYRGSDTIDQLLERADRALYDAKRTGRNKIVVAGEDLEMLNSIV